MNGRQRLPPLNALRAFHAVMEHKSLRLAAEELLVTPQAIGQQIRILEDALQVTLLERRGRTIEPTEAALVLSGFVTAGFAELAEGARQVLRAQGPERVSLNVSPYFAARFLLPRLAGLRAALPGIDLRMTTMVDLPDFGRDDIDMAIQWGYGWPKLDVTLLLPDPKIICCTPLIGAQIARAADLARFTLLDAVKSKRLWPDILRHLAVDEGVADRSIGFDDAASMRHATVQGLGIGLLSANDAEEDLKSGALVAPLGRDALGGMPPDEVPGFYLVYPRGHLRVGRVAALHRWLVQQDWTRPPTLLAP